MGIRRRQVWTKMHRISCTFMSILSAEMSTLDGINRIDSLPEHVKNTLGQQALAITDHGNMSGAYKFYKSCNKTQIKPIIGIEAYYTINDRGARELDDDGAKYYHLVMLAENGTGLQNLFKLTSRAYTEGFYHKPRTDDALLAEHSEGVLATSACLGSRASQLILKGRTNEAARIITHHAQIFKDRFYIEVQLHADKEQQTVNQALIEISKQHNLPLILTNDCHYTNQDDKTLHEQTLAMSTNAVMSDPPWNPEAKGKGQGKTRFSFGEIDVHVAHHDWMWNLAQKQGIPYAAIENTRYVADRVQADSYFANIMNRYPHYQELPPDLPSWDALENLTKHKLSVKFGGTPPLEYRQRIMHELKIIKKMGFYDYLLIVWEFMNGAHEVGVMTGPGRGSAAGSLVAYSLGITTVDPIKYGLVFER